jgi:hypothetical protein
MSLETRATLAWLLPCGVADCVSCACINPAQQCTAHTARYVSTCSPAIPWNNWCLLCMCVLLHHMVRASAGHVGDLLII